MAQIARTLQLQLLATNMALPRPTAAVEPRVGELEQQAHLKTHARSARTSLLAMTRVTTPMATKIAGSVNLLPTTLLVGAAEALAVAVQVGLVPLAAPAVEKARFLGKSMTSIGSF